MFKLSIKISPMAIKILSKFLEGRFLATDKIFSEKRPIDEVVSSLCMAH